MGAWVTIEDAAAFIGQPQDSRMGDALAAAETLAQRIRNDLDPYRTPDAAVQYAVKIRTKLLYQSRAAASQLAEYDDFQSADQSALSDFYALLGARKPRIG